MIKLKSLLKEYISPDTLRDMKEFGITKSDIDSNGYIMMYHGGKKLPTHIKDNQIFFITPDKSLAADYARMRDGKVFEFKVKPEDVRWNTGSYEVEVIGGGIIKNGVLTIHTDDEMAYRVRSYDEMQKVDSKYKSISDAVFKWIERTLWYYIHVDEMTPQDSYVRILSDIDYYYNDISVDDSEFKEFADTLRYTNLPKLKNDIGELVGIDFKDVFDS